MQDIFIVIVAAVAGTGTLLLGLLLKKKRKTVPKNNGNANMLASKLISETDTPAQGVGAFYDAQTDAFLQVYGEVIQAFRTRDVSKLLDSQIEAIGLREGMLAIDAGCGVGGPACYFAAQTGARIQAVTISAVQAEKARTRIAEKGLEEKISVHHGDYHQLDQIFSENSADVVYFLESFGHSHDKDQVFAAAWKVLKPGGKLYIKDLFLKEVGNEALRPAMEREVKRINSAYHYHIADLYAVLQTIRQTGWILASLKTIDIPLEDFENLSISNDFQELTGIGKIDNWKDYIFPIDFFELVCYKPWLDPEVGNSRYFLQNLYYMQVKGKTEAEIAAMKFNPEDGGPGHG